MSTAEVEAPAAPSLSVHRAPLSDSPGAFRIGALVDPMRKRYIKLMLYGAPGTGKTTLAGSAVDLDIMADVLMLQFEGGQEVLLDNERIERPDLADIIRIKRIEQLQKIYEFLLHHCRYRDAGKDRELEKLQLMTFGYVNEDGSNMEALPEGDRLRKYRTVILDSLTEMEAQNLAVALKLDAVGVENAGEVEKAGWDEFRLNNHTIQRIVRAFRDLDMNVILICGQRYDQDELKRYHYSPALTGKLSTQVQGFVDVVGWLVVGSNAEGRPMRRLAVQPHTGPKADAKSRFAAYKEPHFDDPTMKDLMLGFGLIVSEGKPKSGK